MDTICAQLAPLPNLCRAALFEVLREFSRAFRLVLLRGGAHRRYAPSDHALFASDLESLSEVFAAGGGGGAATAGSAAAAAGKEGAAGGGSGADGTAARLTRAQVELLVRPLLNIVMATAMDSDVLIAKFEVRAIAARQEIQPERGASRCEARRPRAALLQSTACGPRL